MTDDRPLILQQLDGQWEKIAIALIYKLSRGSRSSSQIVI